MGEPNARNGHRGTGTVMAAFGPASARSHPAAAYQGARRAVVIIDSMASPAISGNHSDAHVAEVAGSARDFRSSEGRRL